MALVKSKYIDLSAAPWTMHKTAICYFLIFTMDYLGYHI